jgi:hypothetical protein
MEKKFFPLLILLLGINFSAKSESIYLDLAQGIVPGIYFALGRTFIAAANIKNPAIMGGSIQGILMGACIDENYYKDFLKAGLRTTAGAFALSVIKGTMDTILADSTNKKSALDIITNSTESCFAFAVSSLGCAAMVATIRWFIFGKDDFKKDDSAPKGVLEKKQKS